MNMSERRQLRRNRKNESSDKTNLVSDGNSTDTDAVHSSEQPQQYDNQAYEDDASETNSNSGKSQMKAALIGKHRDKSREVAQRIPEEDPNAVVEELHIVRDRIKDKIKANLKSELLLAKTEEAAVKESGDDKDKGKSDLKLDLSLSTAEQAGPSRLSNVTGRTDNTTLRESSAQRAKKIQEQAEEKSNYRLKGTTKRETTRFDTPDSKKDLDEITEVTQGGGDENDSEKQETKAKKKFKQIGHAVMDDRHIPTRTEQFDFFTNDKFVQEDDEEKADKKQGKTSKTAAKEADEANKQEDAADEKTTLIMEIDDSFESHYKKAIYIPHDKQKEIERKFLFMPSAKVIPISQKLGGTETDRPRFLENEGYYVGKKPYMTLKNKNMMADRLLKLYDQRGLKWFGPDGELVALPDPIKYMSTRPSLNPTYTEEIETEYNKALFLRDYANNPVLAEKAGNMRAIGNAIAKYRIDLDINQAHFNFHHLFSGEHILAFRLKNMYRHYLLTQEQNLVEILTAKLSALKEAQARFKSELDSQMNRVANVQNNYVQSTSSVINKNLQNKVSQVDINKLNAYKNEIKQARQQRDNETMLKKDLLEKILTTWKELKDLRTKQGYRNTDVKLTIRRKECDEQKELAQDDKDLKEELEEILAEKNEEYQLELSVYNQKTKAYKFQQIKKTEARRRVDKREKEEAENKPVNFNIKVAQELKEQQEADMRTIMEEDLPKPEKPAEVDKDRIVEELKAHYAKVRKIAGEPELFFNLIEDAGSITPTAQCSQKEQARRNKLSHTKVYVKIIFNGKQVFTTNFCQLQNDFTVKWAQIFNIFMITFPDSIVLQIFEFTDSKSNERMIAQLNLPMPEAHCSTLNYSLENYDFASPHAFYMHLEKSNQLEVKYTSGTLKAGAGWGIDERDGSILVPPTLKSNSDAVIKHDEMKGYDAIAALGVSRMQDIERLTKWIIKSNLDPNDPRNADLINLIKNITEGDGVSQSFDGLKLPEHFRLNQLMEEFNFVTDEEIENNKRNKLISLRAQDEPEFRGLKMLPNQDRYVKRDTFDAYEKRKMKENNLQDDDDEEEDKNASLKSPKDKEMKNEIELARNAGQKHVRKIRQQILAQFKFIQSMKTLSDMVLEEQVPDINALSSIFYNLYVEPKRPLYPMRRERKKLTGQNLSSEDVKILVNVVNAYDLPIRKDKLNNDPMRIIKDPVTGKSIKIHEYIAGESLVKPFVEVSFQDTVYRTSTADGPNASWNQEIHLPFKAPNNDLRPDSLQTCKDNLFFNVYDEVQVDALEDERDRGNVVHKKIMRFWLGCLKIPFSTIYFKSKIEGTFKLESPPFMIGYTRDPRLSRIKSSLEDTTLNMEQPFRDSSYITLFITIEPQLMIPEYFRESYDTIENIDLLEKVVNWSTAFTKKWPNREFKPTVMNTEGKSVVITRYFKPLKPPAELIDNDNKASEKTINNIVRFVSLIPFVSDSLIFPGICDVWATCDEFLYILSGDEEEHSVLLVNFFLGIGKEAWLLVGSSITDGMCSYALTVEGTDYTIWYQGQPYKVNEPHNPVKCVSAIVNDKNIWLNIQSFDEPYRIKFNLNDSKCWRPFFNKSNNLMLPSIQKDELRYFPTEMRFVKELESKIETRLREKLQEWRPRHLTKFNRYGCSALRLILNNIEENRNILIQNDLEELKQLEASYRISGFPINLPYTNMTAIYEAVQATQVHAMPTSEMEYALAVHIAPYPNTIMAVWIYIAVLTRK